MRLKTCIAQVSLAFLLTLQIFSHHNVLAEGESCNRAGEFNNAPGICVNIKSCPPYVQILRQQGPKASDFVAKAVCSYSGDGPVVCCPTSTSPTLPTTQSSQPESPRTTSSSYGPLSAPYCGFSRASHNRASFGFPTDVDAWPWLAVLGYKDATQPDKSKWLCGGSLISKQHILTAARCVYGRDDLYLARLGEYNLNDSIVDGANPIDVPIQRMVVHPGYSNVSHVNDIAVLRLQSPVDFTAAIHPICLPIPPEVRDRNYIKNFPWLAGWGMLDFKGPGNEILHESLLPVVTNEACAEAYVPFKERVIDQRVICAGYIGRGLNSCISDIGGAMMFPKSLYHYLIGVVSYIPGCGNLNQPGVYTRVTEFMDFITENMN